MKRDDVDLRPTNTEPQRLHPHSHIVERKTRVTVERAGIGSARGAWMSAVMRKHRDGIQ
jgi:hypothetical protein